MHGTEKSLLAVFATLLAACAVDDEPRQHTTTTSATSTNDCWMSHGSDSVVVYGAAAAGIRENPGDPAFCEMACAVYAKEQTASFGPVSVDPEGTCRVVGPVPPGLDDSDDDDDGGDASGSSSSTGSASTGATTTAAADEGSTGATGDPEDWGYEVECPLREQCWNVGGRGHAGVRSGATIESGEATACWLAAAAHEEAASVHAFEALCVELSRLGAPLHFIARAKEAAADERRHAQSMTALAIARGATPNPVVFDPPRLRTLEAIALENTVEGCVRETWAAFEAAHQAERAPDPELRAVMATIARDEARHAALALDLDRWFRSQLDSAAQRRLDDAHDAAIERLDRATHSTGDVGLPPATRAPDLRAALFSATKAAA